MVACWVKYYTLFNCHACVHTSESFSNSDTPSSLTASHKCAPLWCDYYNKQYIIFKWLIVILPFTWAWNSLLPKCSHFQPILRCSMAQCSGLYLCRCFHCSSSSIQITLHKSYFIHDTVSSEKYMIIATILFL